MRNNLTDKNDEQVFLDNSLKNQHITPPHLSRKGIAFFKHGGRSHARISEKSFISES
jgi:hypothetical protein